VSDGRVFDAEQARSLGLVDEIGDLRAAIDAGKKAAGVQKATVVRYRRSGESADTLHARWSGEPDAQAFSMERGAAARRGTALPVHVGSVPG
jgi:ClpP class serine protease